MGSKSDKKPLSKSTEPTQGKCKEVKSNNFIGSLIFVMLIWSYRYSMV